MKEYLSNKFIVIFKHILSQRKSIECIKIYKVWLLVATLLKSKKTSISKTLTKVHLDTTFLTIRLKTPHIQQMKEKRWQVWPWALSPSLGPKSTKLQFHFLLLWFFFFQRENKIERKLILTAKLPMSYRLTDSSFSIDNGMEGEITNLLIGINKCTRPPYALVDPTHSGSEIQPWHV